MWPSQPAQLFEVAVQVVGGVFHRGQDQDRAGFHRWFRSGPARGKQESNQLRDPRTCRPVVAQGLAWLTKSSMDRL